LQDLQRLLGMAGLQYMEASLVKIVGEHQPDEKFIFNDQYGLSL